MIINRPLAHGGLLKPTHIVIHAMGEFIRPNKLDCTKLGITERDYHATEWLEILGYSAHALITPSGDEIRCLALNVKGAHAKAQGFNHKSLGLEFLVAGVYNIGTLHERIKESYLGTRQRWEGVDLISRWHVKFNIPIENIVKHSAIDEKKQDPGDGFSWDDFIDRVERNIQRGVYRWMKKKQ